MGQCYIAKNTAPCPIHPDRSGHYPAEGSYPDFTDCLTTDTKYLNISLLIAVNSCRLDLGGVRGAEYKGQGHRCSRPDFECQFLLNHLLDIKASVHPSPL